MTAQKIVSNGLVFEAKRNGDVEVSVRSEAAGRVVSHLDTIRLAYWLVKQYAKAVARRSEGGR